MDLACACHKSKPICTKTFFIPNYRTLVAAGSSLRLKIIVVLEQGSEWKSLAVNISRQNLSVISIVAVTVTGRPDGDIAIDDVTVCEELVTSR